MIEKEWEGRTKVFVPVCDICGKTLPAEYEFADAVEAKKNAGWGLRKMNNEWIDICDDCRWNAMIRRNYGK